MKGEWKLQVTGVTVESQLGSAAAPPSARRYTVFLDVKAEAGQRQRLALGSLSFAEDRHEALSGLVYVASTPIRVRAFAQARVTVADLGVHTLYEHLHRHGKGEQGGPLEGSLAFGTRRRGPAIVRVHYRLAPLRLRFVVQLAEVRCLQQPGWWPGPEHLASAAGAASFELGAFRALDRSSPETYKLAVVTRTEARFAARQRPWGARPLGAVLFVPEDELGPGEAEGAARAGSLAVLARGGSATCEEPAAGAEGGSAGTSGTTVTVVLDQRYALVFRVAQEPVRPTARRAPGGPEQQRQEEEEEEEEEEESAAVPAHESAWSVAPVTLNRAEVLVDGLQTFERYFAVLVGARHSIAILAWELSLSFGLITRERGGASVPGTTPRGARWVALEDVLLDRARAGVAVRVVVWRHQLLSYVNRFLYLGDVTIEAEVQKLMARGRAVGVPVHMVHATAAPSPQFADPHGAAASGRIVVVIVGSPRGLLSSHHEKLVLVDAECAAGHGAAFVGGFDIARGRYDQPLHQIPRPYFELHPPQQQQPRYTGSSVQPVLRRIRFLWHDLQLLLQGPSVRQLHLHFAQRWLFAFSGSGAEARAHALPPLRLLCDETPVVGPEGLMEVQLSRCWRGVLDVQKMFEVHRQTIRRAKRFLFIEHQYPFHNWGLSHEMCEALAANPLLKVVIVTAIKTDLPTGIVGDIVDWSQDHITQHLLHIEKQAADRVVVVGLCRQDEYRKLIKPIYVHSKLVIADDQVLLTGSANMDDMSFFYSSELTVSVASSSLAKSTRLRLASEHLGHPAPEDFDSMFQAFRAMATENLAALASDTPLQGRVVFMAPKKHLELLLSRVYYPNKVSKALYKLGLNTEDWVDFILSKLPEKIRSRL